MNGLRQPFAVCEHIRRKEWGMIKAAVIADDLTGGNAAGILLKKKGLDAVTYLNSGAECDDAPCCIFSTNSRGLEKQEAYDSVYRVTKALYGSGTQFFSKRIDSTMRGNVGAEIDGMLDALGSDVMAVCTPAYPDSGRTVEQGRLYVNQVLLADSALADDPKSRIAESRVSRVIQSQSVRKVWELAGDETAGTAEEISEKMDEAFKNGYRILVCDAKNNEDLEKMAQAIAVNSHRIITADPGVLTALTAGIVFGIQPAMSGHKVLAVVGSVNPAVKRQLETLWNSGLETGRILVCTKNLLNEESCKREIKRVMELVRAEKEHSVILTIAGDGIYPENRIEMTEELSVKINGIFGRIARKILEENREYKGLYTSGGDITFSVYRELGTRGIRVLDEILPLAVFGTLTGGEFQGLPVITKGGSQGDDRAIETCVRYLFEAVNSGSAENSKFLQPYNFKR